MTGAVRALPIGSADGGAAETRALPHNIEAEQALLGAILMNNEACDSVPFLDESHFFDPVHGRIFATAKRRFQDGKLTTPVTLKTVMERDQGLQELGGPAYLAHLAEAAITIFNARDYAQSIYELAQRRRLAEIAEEVQGLALDPSNETEPENLIQIAEEQLYRLSETGQKEGGFKTFSRALVEALDTANAAYQRRGGLAGLSSGLSDMDQKMGGLHNSDLIILAGRPSMGKTALATNVAFNVARDYLRGLKDPQTGKALEGGVVGFFSLEMSAEQLATRILAEQAEVPQEKIRKGDLAEDEFRRFALVAQDLEHAPLFIDDTPAQPVAQIAARARRLKRQHGLDLLVIDYLQLCRGSAKNDGNRVQEVSEITQGLKAIAKELNIPVIALSQLSRQVENRDDKRPQLSDLRESGSIEQDADVVMFVYREEYYVGRTEPTEGTPEHLEWQEKMAQVHNLAEVIIGKQRHGPIGTVKLMFDSRFTRFGDLVRQGQTPAPGQ